MINEWIEGTDYTTWGPINVAAAAQDLLDEHPEIHKTDLANAIGIDRGTLDGWLSGKVTLTAAKYQMFLDGLITVCRQNNIPVDVTPKGFEFTSEQACEIVDKARESLQNIIMCLSPYDLVNLENTAWSLYQNDPRILRHFYDCTPPVTPKPDESPADIEQAWQKTMDNAEALLQPARDVERTHNELVEITQRKPQKNEFEPEYPSWQALDAEWRQLSIYQYLNPHDWLEAWPEDRKDEYNYYVLKARVYEVDEEMKRIEQKVKSRLHPNEGE